MKENLKWLLPLVLRDLKNIQKKDTEDLTLKEIEKRLSMLESNLTNLVSAIFNDTKRGEDGNTWVEWWLYERVEKIIIVDGEPIDVTESINFFEFLLKQQPND